MGGTPHSQEEGMEDLWLGGYMPRHTDLFGAREIHESHWCLRRLIHLRRAIVINGRQRNAISAAASLEAHAHL